MKVEYGLAKSFRAFALTITVDTHPELDALLAFFGGLTGNDIKVAVGRSLYGADEDDVAATVKLAGRATDSLYVALDDAAESMALEL